jgi:hypothetical protein
MEICAFPYFFTVIDQDKAIENFIIFVSLSIRHAKQNGVTNENGFNFYAIIQ